MRTIIVGDLHINERAIEEIETIFDKDIIPLVSGNHYDRLIQLGDWFDFNRPTPMELKFSSELVQNLKIFFKEIIIISGTGEHDILHNESAISHLASLGVKTIKGDYIDNNILYGHFMLHESKLSFGTGRMGIKDLEKYKYVFLGHQHTPEKLGNNIFHIGSIRYCSFNEIDDIKHVFILENDKFHHCHDIQCCIPMKDIYNISELEKIDARTKVRFVCKSFEQYRLNASLLNKLGKKFNTFKIKLDFKTETIKDLIVSKTEAKTITKDEIIRIYLEKIEDKAVRKLLEEIINEK
jgi:DNA repair exonuclease SbcCD nuclease subunit